jgi:uncharacterized protein YndB with AHSA1/START domain
MSIDVDTGAVRVERTYEAPAEAVFDAWTNPEVLRRWWRADPSHEVTVVADVRPGGDYRLTMRRPDGEPMVVHGTYREATGSSTAGHGRGPAPMRTTRARSR